MLGFLTVFWGLAFFLIAVGLRGFPPLTLVVIRLAVGAAALYPLMRWQGGRLPTEGAWWARFAALALMGNLIPFSLISWAETRITSGQAGLLMALMPISTILLAHLFVAHEQLTSRRLSGIALGFVGVGILVGADAVSSLGGGQLIAQLAVILATLAYAVNAVYTKRLPTIDTLVVATGSLIIGTLMLAPIALIIEQPWHHAPSLDAVSAVVVLGVFSTGLATWVYFRVVSDCGPGFLSIINYMIPAVAYVAGVLFLGEPAEWSQFAGLLVICAGIFLSQARQKTFVSGDV